MDWSERTTNWSMVEGAGRVFGVVDEDSKRCHMLVDGRNLRNFFGFKKLSDDRSQARTRGVACTLHSINNECS